MYQDSEVACLVMCVIAAGLIGRFSNKEIPQFRYFYWGFLCLGSSFLATVAEGFLWPDLFNSIEHLSAAVSGWLFVIACHKLYRVGAAVQGNAVDVIPQEMAAPMAGSWLKAH